MPFDGNGTYSPPSPAYPAIAGAVITALNRNTIDADLANALSNVVTRDGQSPPSANLPMGARKLTGLAAGSGAGDSLRFEQLFGANAATVAGARANLSVPSILELQNQTDTAFTTAGTSAAYTLTPVPAVAAIAVNQRWRVSFHVACALAPTLSVSGLPAAGLVYYDAAGALQVPAAGQIPVNWQSDVTQLVSGQYLLDQVPVPVARGLIGGLTLSTAGASTTFTAAAGAATDSANTVQMILGTAIAKTTAAWAVGTANGGLDTGAIAANTWYHPYLIYRPDTGVADVCFSLSAAAPTTGVNVPAAYTKFRRLGAIKTNGSSQWASFVQTGDDFAWLATVLDYSTVNPGSGAAISVTLASVPTGVRVDVDLMASSNDSANTCAGYLLSDLSVNAESPIALSNESAWLSVAGQPALFNGKIKTNTSAQIRAQMSIASGTFTLNIRVRGWTDTRGRNA